MVDAVPWCTAACRSSKVATTVVVVGSNVTDVGDSVRVGYGVGVRVGDGVARAPVSSRRSRRKGVMAVVFRHRFPPSPASWTMRLLEFQQHWLH